MPINARSVSDVRRLHDEGVRLKYLFFWGHRPSRDGSVGAGCLSQWWAGHPFTVDGTTYATAEHWMMAGKARLFGDEDALKRVVAARSAAEAKAIGREVRGYDDGVWTANRAEIVAEGNVHKFGEHAELTDYLLATGSRVLVEASPRDRIWGIGMGASNESVEDPHAWRGLNLLGFALMEARARLSGVR